jgi:hypothetical protein
MDRRYRDKVGGLFAAFFRAPLQWQLMNCRNAIFAHFILNIS